jgi:hypothetical protein
VSNLAIQRAAGESVSTDDYAHARELGFAYLGWCRIFVLSDSAPAAQVDCPDRPRHLIPRGCEHASGQMDPKP